MKIFAKKKSAVSVALALFVGGLSGNLSALPVHAYYINGMSTSRAEARKEVDALQNKITGYRPELVYSSTADSDGDGSDGEGFPFDGAAILNFENELIKCDGKYSEIYRESLEDNCKKKQYLKSKIILNTSTHSNNAVHIVSYSRGNILANVVMDESLWRSRPVVVRRINIASPVGHL